jgi:Tc toxin complex TcA C-terminal TcB-binding domain
LSIRQARLELTQIEKQKIAAQIRLQIAEKELNNHETQMAQSEEVRDFLRGKFTNRELYQWMVGELSRTYRKVYNLAYDVAKTAERAFQFELGISDTDYIEFGYFDSLRQGLLAGEKLSYDVKRMDVGYLQKDKREFEITKSISLAQLNPLALQALREDGECTLSLPEVLFDLDFPGQYFRRIQAVRLTIPCVTGPYTSVSAKLSLLGSAVRVQSAAGSNYPYQGVDDPRFVHDVGGIQSIATSTAQDDAGLFELNFRDERYLPFEGCGAISRWRLELPGNGPTPRGARQFDYNTISDVILTVSYTARDAGGSLRQGAIAALEIELNRVLDVLATQATGLGRVFSLKREFPDGLHQLLTSGSTTLTIQAEHFPYLFRDRGYALNQQGMLTMAVMPRGGASETVSGSVNFALNTGAPSGPVAISGTGVTRVDVGAARTQPLFNGGNSEQWTISQAAPNNLTLNPNNVDDIVFELRYTVAVA